MPDADPPGVEMYVKIGKTKAGLTLWRCKRGSSKNEAANLVIERSLHTTAKMTQLTATGWLQFSLALLQCGGGVGGAVCLAA